MFILIVSYVIYYILELNITGFNLNMADEKNYDCFVLNVEKTATLRHHYLNEVSPKREALSEKLYSDTGAIAHVENGDMQGGTYIASLVFPADAEIATSPDAKVTSKQEYQGQMTSLPPIHPLDPPSPLLDDQVRLPAFPIGE